ncbi:MAG: 1,4-dihydroxy-6-naphthoate synthase [Saprospiraceae bacterium]|nr:1,4-dihydroxy-6-naphthoate synthase [Saprospiraceae bacterium]
MKLTLGFSPCPNDTFIFDALVNGHIDCRGLEFDVVLEDVEALNQLAAAEVLDVTKLSYHAYAFLLNKYNLLSVGSALGNNCGPLLIANQPLTSEELRNGSTAIPGDKTTAHFLLQYYDSTITNKEILLFSDIENAVLNEEVQAGVIIHENRFTYKDKGLVKIVDLGEHWETSTGYPIPLGGITMHQRIPVTIQQRFHQVLSDSLQWAFQQPQLSEYVKEHAQEMNKAVMKQHIDLYVNDFSKNLGELGKAAIFKMLDTIGIQEKPTLIESL